MFCPNAFQMSTYHTHAHNVHMLHQQVGHLQCTKFLQPTAAVIFFYLILIPTTMFFTPPVFAHMNIQELLKGENCNIIFCC